MKYTLVTNGMPKEVVIQTDIRKEISKFQYILMLK